MTALDTNVLIYACDKSDPRRQQIAIELIASVTDGVLLWQVACEFVAASRKLNDRGFTPIVSIWGPASGRLDPHQRLTRQDVGAGTLLGFSDPHFRLTLCLSSELSVARERASEAPASPTV